jgi:hypothetical protein
VSVLAEESVVVASRDVMTADFSPDLVLLNLQDGIYYGVEEVGTRVWTLIESPVAVRTILDTIAAEFDVARARSDRDVRAFLEELVDRGLATVCGDAR